MLAIGKRLIRKDANIKGKGSQSRMIIRHISTTIKDQDCQDDFFVKFEESGP